MEESKIQESFAPLRMTTSLPINDDLSPNKKTALAVFNDGRPRFCPGPSLALYPV